VDVTAALAEVRRRIGDEVRIVAVTKGHGVDAVQAALAAGLTDVGESYAQELREKAAVDGVSWHFVGRLQTNKVRQVADLVHLWQSVDRDELADEIARRAPGAAVLVQVNVSGEPQKGGCDPADVAALVARCADIGLGVRGLMTVGHPADPRPGFRLLAGLADDLGLPERSMGMSGDLEIAVEEGATMVRVGRALFGPRPRTPRTVTVGSRPERPLEG
jgi:pyridoxal phosphate enzyme (YggS family)